MCLVQSEYKGNQKGWRAAEGRQVRFEAEAEGHRLGIGSAQRTCVALNTAHVLHLHKANVLALKKVHVLRSHSKISCVLKMKCLVISANTHFL